MKPFVKAKIIEFTKYFFNENDPTYSSFLYHFICELCSIKLIIKHHKENINFSKADKIIFF